MEDKQPEKENYANSSKKSTSIPCTTMLQKIKLKKINSVSAICYEQVD